MGASLDLRRILTDDVFVRSTGAELIRGNGMCILRDGRENYPRWEEAIREARKTVHIDMYIIYNDKIGRHFRDLLRAKAREGVKVRVLYDWFGSIGLLASRFWAPLRKAGGEVRAMNPPGFKTLLGLASRDHRKLIAVDGRRAFIAGLCIGDAWVGNPERNILPWRDTGVEIRGPAVADAEAAFASSWKLAGGCIASSEVPAREDLPEAGSVPLRIVAATPDGGGLYRLDLLVAAAAQERLWLSDAYFIGTTPYIQALRAAAEAGVDVRLLVPHSSDVQWIANLSRTMYRSLLEGGVRIFEWNGSMMHAKTAVADGRWARVGSTNLNLASWLGNWELDVVIEDRGAAREMSDMYLEDLARSTEIIIAGRKVRPAAAVPRMGRRRRRSGSGKHVLSGVARMSSALNAAVTGKRPLHIGESASLFSIAAVLVSLAVIGIFFPRVIAYPVALLAAWAGIFTLARALRLRFRKEREEEDIDGKT